MTGKMGMRPDGSRKRGFGEVFFSWGVYRGSLGQTVGKMMTEPFYPALRGPGGSRAGAAPIRPHETLGVVFQEFFYY